MQPTEKEVSVQSLFHMALNGKVAALPAAVFKDLILCALASLGCPEALGTSGGGGAALQEQGVAAVAHPHRLGVGGQGQFVAGACIAEDVATVSAVVLEDRKAAITGHQSPLGCTPTPYFQPLPRGRYQFGRSSKS